MSFLILYCIYSFLSFFYLFFFFFNDTATTEIYTLSLHDALPISTLKHELPGLLPPNELTGAKQARDRKSTRLNSSHSQISYAVFCLKKKNQQQRINQLRSLHQRQQSTLFFQPSR